MKELTQDQLNGIWGGILPLVVPAVGWWLVGAGFYGLVTVGYKGRPATTEELLMHQYNYSTQ